MELKIKEIEEIDRKIKYINRFCEDVISWSWQNNQFCISKKVIDSYCFVGTYTYSFIEFICYLETEIFIMEATNKTLENKVI